MLIIGISLVLIVSIIVKIFDDEIRPNMLYKRLIILGMLLGFTLIIISIVNLIL